jgi:hypothetical protein
MKDLLSPEQVQDIQSFEERRKKLKELVTQARRVPTPKEHTKKKGNFDVVNFDYLNEQMDSFHPQRSFKIIKADFDKDTLTYFFAVEVTDLQTGESRPGTAVHPVIAYEAGSETLKSKKNIREQMSNAAKAALTEAIRDAYAHFGIAADMYGMEFKEPVSEEQQQKFNSLIDELNKLTPEDAKSKFADWVTVTRTKWSKEYEQTAEVFLNDLQNKLNKQKEKLDGSAR